MIDKLSYKSRVYLLMIIGLLFCILCYHLAFKKTILLSHNVKASRIQVELCRNSINHINIMENKLAEIELVLGSETNHNNPQEALLERTSIYCRKNHLSIVELPEAEIIFNSDYRILFQKITIKGGYKKLLGLLYELERDRAVGAVVSVMFFKEINLRSKQESLYIQIVLKSISLIYEN